MMLLLTVLRQKLLKHIPKKKMIVKLRVTVNSFILKDVLLFYHGEKDQDSIKKHYTYNLYFQYY